MNLNKNPPSEQRICSDGGCFLQLEAVLQGHNAVVNAGMLAVGGEVAVAHELEALAGLGIL